MGCIATCEFYTHPPCRVTVPKEAIFPDLLSSPIMTNVLMSLPGAFVRSEVTC
jgi:hypothetical protein